MYVDKAGEFRFRLKAANGEIIAASEGYKAKESCENGIQSVRENAPWRKSSRNKRYLGAPLPEREGRFLWTRGMDCGGKTGGENAGECSCATKERTKIG